MILNVYMKLGASIAVTLGRIFLCFNLTNTLALQTAVL